MLHNVIDTGTTALDKESKLPVFEQPAVFMPPYEGCFKTTLLSVYSKMYIILTFMSMMGHFILR